MNFSFSAEEEDFRGEVRAFLEPYRGLEGFYGQGHCWPEVKRLFQRRKAPLVITPHLGEAARLLRKDKSYRNK